MFAFWLCMWMGQTIKNKNLISKQFPGQHSFSGSVRATSQGNAASQQSLPYLPNGMRGLFGVLPSWRFNWAGGCFESRSGVKGVELGLAARNLAGKQAAEASLRAGRTRWAFSPLVLWKLMEARWVPSHVEWCQAASQSMARHGKLTQGEVHLLDQFMVIRVMFTMQLSTGLLPFLVCTVIYLSFLSSSSTFIPLSSLSLTFSLFFLLSLPPSMFGF